MKKMKLIIIIITIGFSVLGSRLPAGKAEAASNEKESFFVAQKAFQDGFYEVSLGLFERFLNNYPVSEKSAQARLFISQCYFHQHRYLDALNQLERLDSMPDSKAIKDALWYWIGEVHFRGNSFSKAQEYYRKIINQFPQSSYLAASYYSLAWCYFQEHNYKEALVYFDEIEKKFTQDSYADDARFKIVECFYSLKNYALAKEKANLYLKRYGSDKSRMSTLYFYIGESDYYLSNFAEAVKAYKQATELAVDSRIKALAQLGVGWSELKQKHIKEAKEGFQAVQENDLENKSRDILLLGRASLSFETKDYNEAKKNYETLAMLTADPLNIIQANMGKADALYQLGKYKEAVATYKEVLVKINQDQTIGKDIEDKAQYGLAWALLKDGEFKEAIEYFQKIARFSSDAVVKVSALCQIGDAYQDTEEYDLAIKAYDTILKDYPGSLYGDYVQYQLGMTLMRISQYGTAIMALKKVAQEYPDTKLLDDASYALGLAYFQKQDYAQSQQELSVFEDKFKDSSLRSQALYLLGASFYNLDNFVKAIEVFKSIIRIYPQDAELIQKAEYEIADCFYRMGDEKEALSRFKALQQKYPVASLTSEVIWWLGEYYYRKQDLESAKQYFLTLVNNFAQSNLVADAWYILGSICAEQGELKEAKKYFDKVKNTAKTDLSGQATISLADLYFKEGEAAQAQQLYESAVKNFPHLATTAYPKLAQLYVDKADFAQGLIYYRKSLEVAPALEAAEIQFKIAQVVQAQGNVDQAVEEYLKVTYLYSENEQLKVKSLLRVASLYEEKEKFKEAFNIYKRIVSMNMEESKYAQERLDWIRDNEGG